MATNAKTPATPDQVAAVRLDERRKYLKECWVRTKIVEHFSSFGIPSFDDEVRATWGDWSTRKTPYELPFNGGPIPAEYVDPDPSALKRAVQDAINGRPLGSTSAKPCPSPEWGVPTVKKARAYPGFDLTPQSKLDDCSIARAIWADWQRLDKKTPNKVNMILARWVANALTLSRSE